MASARSTRPVRLLLVTAVSAALVGGAVSAPSAVAAGNPTPPPNPQQRQQQLTKQIPASYDDVSASEKALAGARTRYTTSQTAARAAGTAYASAQGALAAATAKEAVASKSLATAKSAQQQAEAAVTAGEAAVTRQRTLIGQAVQAGFQQRTDLVAFSFLLGGRSTGDISDDLQIQSTVFDRQHAALTGLTAKLTHLNQLRAASRTATARTATAETAAAAAVAERRTAAGTAATRKASLDAANARSRAALVASTNARNTAWNQYYALVNEQIRVTKRLRAMALAERRRIAHEKALAAARARAAAAAARAKAAAEARARAEAARQGLDSHATRPTAPAPPRSRPSSSPPSTSYHPFFERPIPGAPITSGFGRRFHPILHYWKLHDGTDFGASCGTPIHASAGGVVTDRYFNAGYGNRLMVSDGYHDGHVYTTSYNHLSRYAVGVGDHVDQGDVIGYVGATGYATGCHLHFMIFSDGDVKDAEPYLP